MDGEGVAVKARQIGGGGVRAGSSTRQRTMNPEPNASASAADQAQGLIATLFDFSFNSFVTTKFIKLIYVLFMLVAGGAVLVFIGIGFKGGFMQGILCLILSPVVAFIYLFFARMWTELIIVVFRIAEHLRSIDAKTPPRA